MENKELINLIDDVFKAVDYVLNELDEDKVYNLEESILWNRYTYMLIAVIHHTIRTMVGVLKVRDQTLRNTHEAMVSKSSIFS